jgi:hypothetical protein
VLSDPHDLHLCEFGKAKGIGKQVISAAMVKGVVPIRMVRASAACPQVDSS